MMQTASRNLPLLNIELAQRKQQQQLAKLAAANSSSSSNNNNDNVASSNSSGNSAAEVNPNPLSPLSPPTFLTASLPPTVPAPTEILFLNDRYLLLEFIEGAVSPQSLPLRRCVDTVTEDTFFCRECPSRAPSTVSLLEAHHRLRGSDAVTPIRHVIHDGNGKVYLLSPASYGDLHSYLRVKRRLKEAEARSLFRQAAQAVHDCHRHGVVLTDLKLRRFVFSDPQRTKLRLESLEEAIVLERSDSDDGVWRKHGYPAYVTPEVLLSRGARYSGRAADLWSLGIILYTLLVGRYPFQDSAPFGLFTKIIRGHFAVPDFVSSRARCLIRNLLRREPAQRLEAADILHHPWFSAVLRTAKADLVKTKPESAGARSEPATAATTTMNNGSSAATLVDQVVPEALSDSRMDF